MPPLARRTRVILALAALVAALAAWQGAAVGAITTTGASITGAVSDTSPPGGVMDATVTATVDGGSTWRATGVEWGSLRPDCANHDDRTTSGSRTFKVTAPGEPGEYTVGFTPNEADNCKGAKGTTKTLAKALRVTSPGPNPDLPPRCGINVMLVLDSSGSIGDTPGAEEAVISATNAFLSALSGTGAQVSIIDFDTSAVRAVPYTTVTPASIANNGVFDKYLDSYDPDGWTNWQDAFVKVKQANDQGPKADLVVFITDGDPTARNTSSGQKTNIPEGAVEALEPAWAEADRVKAQGSHVFALGVGSAVTKPTSARRLTAISGFDQFPPNPLTEADYTLVEDFDDLAQALRDVAIALCKASVTVTKLVDEEGDGTYLPAEGWKFTATVSTSPGGYEWVQPAPPPATGPREQTTNTDGVATFQWKPANATATSTVSLTEAVYPGYQFVDYVCSKSAPGRTKKKTVSGQAGGNVVVGTLGPNEYATCTVRNKKTPPQTGSITIIKDSVPNDPHVFNFTGTAPIGNFALSDDGKPEPPTQQTFYALPPGTYTVSEAQQNPNNRLAPTAQWRLTGIACNDRSVIVQGPEVRITLRAGGAVTCTFQNTRGDEPDPPDPPVPPDPPDPPKPPNPSEPDLVPTAPPPTTRITVEKTAPRFAKVGTRVPFELTVTNQGSVAARQVIMTDVPPATLSLAGLQSGGPRARRVQGNAQWALGTLAPGATRTIRGTVGIEGGSPGLHRNKVLATAVNANLAQDNADTRIRAIAQRRIIPPVTG